MLSYIYIIVIFFALAIAVILMINPKLLKSKSNKTRLITISFFLMLLAGGVTIFTNVKESKVNKQIIGIDNTIDSINVVVDISQDKFLDKEERPNFSSKDSLMQSIKEFENLLSNFIKKDREFDRKIKLMEYEIKRQKKSPIIHSKFEKFKTEIQYLENRKQRNQNEIKRVSIKLEKLKAKLKEIESL